MNELSREKIHASTDRELNVLVAQHVMNWEWIAPLNQGTTIISDGYWWNSFLEEPVFNWKPAEDISDALLLIEKLKEIQLYMDIRTYTDFYEVWVTDRNTNLQTKTEAHPVLARAITTCAILTVLGV